jgi:hypothetical protein
MCIVSAVALALFVSVPAHAADTARAALKEATAAAQKWQADAVLTHVSTLMGRGDGKADSWLYTYYSPGAKKSAIVTTRDKAVTEVTADVRNTSTHPLGAEYLDSDKAAEAAVRHGLQIGKGAKGIGYGLVVGNTAVGKPQLFWSVTQMAGESMSSVTLNAGDGALIKRDELKFK